MFDSSSAIEDLKKDLAKIRTGRASASLVEDLKVEAYETTMVLRELAAISVPEARQLLITPWDKSTLEAAEKALREAGFSPVVADDALRINLPPLTGEDRERLRREVGECAEAAKAKVRGIRREVVSEVGRMEEAKELSKDEVFARKKKIDEKVKEANRQIIELAEEKKAQLEL
jgi:ribosome recycling factor